MRRIKALGLALVAAAALAALTGTGTASATTLCKTGGSPEAGCGAGKGEINAATDNVTLSSTNPVFTTAITGVTCKSSELTIDPQASTGSPVLGEVTAMSHSGDCTTSGGTACTVEVKNIPYNASFEGTSLKL